MEPHIDGAHPLPGPATTTRMLFTTFQIGAEVEVRTQGLCARPGPSARRRATEFIVTGLTLGDDETPVE
jgi:hypothetical protein